jgi:phage gp29-like protein
MQIKGFIKSVKSWLNKPIATPETDPHGFFNTLAVLPNPDPILRAMGQADRVYQSIMADSHVVGDIRSIRGEFRSFEYRVVTGKADDPQAEAARLLCEEFLAAVRPNITTTEWLEVMWQMSSAMLTGYRVHEPVWDIYTSSNPMLNGKLLPVQFLDRANRRFRFDAHGNTLLISRGNLSGQAIEPYQAIVSRHMATAENPYGQALLSSCFWLWTFKTGGWEWLVKYSEKHGIPWPIARYPQGTQETEIDDLAEAIENMLDSGYAVVQEGTGIELLVPSSNGNMLPQEALIDRCNREMSKALTSQAMTSELHGVGSRAANEVAAKRQSVVNDADRDIAAESMNQLFQFITAFNIGPDVPYPRLEFFKQEKAGKERAETYDLARQMGARPSKKAMLEELGIPAAEEAADALLPDSQVVQTGFPPGVNTTPATGTAPAGQPASGTVQFSADQLATLRGWTFAKALGLTEADAIELAAAAADTEIEQHVLEPVYRMLGRYEAEGKTLAQFRDDFADMVGGIDDTGLREIVEQALQFGILRGAATDAD